MPPEKHLETAMGEAVTVTIYMPSCLLAVASMLACTHIGAEHTVVFSAQSLAERSWDDKNKW